jgi:hypothetical protein
MKPVPNPTKAKMRAQRRTFLIALAAAGGFVSMTDSFAQATLDEKDPQAAALGYVTDSFRADARKYPKHDNGQLCNGCTLWQSKPADATGSCALFAGKPVNAKGWCSAWSKKA